MTRLSRFQQLAALSPYIGGVLLLVGIFLGFEGDHRPHAVAIISLAFALMALVRFSDSAPWARNLGRFCLLTSLTLVALLFTGLFQSRVGLGITTVFLGLFVATSLWVVWQHLTDGPPLHAAFTMLGLLTNIVLLLASFVALVQLLLG